MPPRENRSRHETTGSTPRRRVLIALGLAVIVLALYARALDNPFIDLDDPDYVATNPHVTSGLTPGNIVWAFTTGHAANWHPLTWIAHMADVALFGMRPWGHHLTSVLLHAANAALLFLVLESLTRAPGRSAFAAALFALHPLRVESVAWVAERKDVLSAFFGLLTLAAYVAYVRRPGAGRYAATAACFVLGLLAKPMLVTLPFLLLLLDVWPLGRASLERVGGDARLRPQGPRATPGARSLPALVLEKVPLLVFAAASATVTYLVQRAGGTVMSFDELPLRVRATNALVATCAYIGKTLWPAALAVRYSFTPGGQPAWKWTAAAVVLVAMTLFALRRLRGAPYLAVGWFWYLGMLVPVIGLIQVGSQALADRYTYLPGIGLAILAAWGVPDILASSTRGPRANTTAQTRAARYQEAGSRVMSAIPRRRHALPAAALAVLALLGAATYAQIGTWSSSIALFDHALAVSPDNYLAENDAGLARSNAGRLEEAIPFFHKALEIWPGFTRARYNLGCMLVHAGRNQEAEPYLREALRQKPDVPMAHYFLGVVLSARGETREALGHFRESLRLDPTSSLSHNQMGIALLKLGQPEEAIPSLREAVRLAPAEPTAHANLGTALVRRGQLDEALAQFGEALRIQPAFPQAQRSLGLALVRAGRSDEALEHLREAVRLDPRDPGARADLEAALAKKGS